MHLKVDLSVMVCHAVYLCILILRLHMSIINQNINIKIVVTNGDIPSKGLFNFDCFHRFYLTFFLSNSTI